MRDDEIRQLVAQSVADALAAKDQEIASAIAEGLRIYADRPVGEKGAPSLQFGVVEQVLETFAYVTLDGQTDAVPINMLGGLVEGERVAVLLVPPSGNLALGMVTPSTPSPGVPPGGTAGQVLTKIDSTDFNDEWDTPGAGSGFPVGPEDDGTGTFAIQTISVAGASAMQSSVVDDATGAGSLVEQTTGAGVAGTAIEAVNPSNNKTQVSVSTNGDVVLGGVGINANVIVGGSAGDSVFMFHLPTSDPGNPGELWNDSGTVKVSP